MRTNKRIAALCGVARDVDATGAKPVQVRAARRCEHTGDSVHKQIRPGNVVGRLLRSPHNGVLLHRNVSQILTPC
jgi:hypothetical protein